MIFLNTVVVYLGIERLLLLVDLRLLFSLRETFYLSFTYLGARFDVQLKNK